MTQMVPVGRFAGIRPRRPAFALVGVAGFTAYVGAVIGGSIVQPMVAPGLTMGWGQQLAGLFAVLLVAAFLPDRRSLLGWIAPKAGWLRPALGCGLAIALLGTLTGLAIGEPPRAHGAEYFLYQATMPGLSEELGFRGLLLGSLLSAFAAIGPRWLWLAVAALPFAALHLLESTGMAALVTAGYTFIAGMMLGRLRLASASLIPCIVAHNVANVGGGLVDLLLIGLR